jgi:hypothetical protein
MIQVALGSEHGYDEEIYQNQEEYVESIPVTAEDEQKEIEEETRRKLYVLSLFSFCFVRLFLGFYSVDFAVI